MGALTLSACAVITLFLSGDVMTGRGIDQVLTSSVDPLLFEPYVNSATDYVRLAERENGAIPAPVDASYVWGEALDLLAAHDARVRIINLETAVTDSGVPWPRKGIHYRMHPGNIDLLTVAGVDACVLANNHVLDWGRSGLVQTLDALDAAGLDVAGAGRDDVAAAAPAVIPAPGDRRVLVFAVGHPSSGIFPAWAATPDHPGVALVSDLGEDGARALGRRIADLARPDDVVIVSIHWGGNWGYEVPAEQRAFAHALIEEAGVDIVHGHSSHHPKAVEVHRGRLVLYGCGDLINDYEGIGGHEEYRGELSLLYLPRVTADGALSSLTMVPMRIERFRLRRADPEDARWLAERLDRECARFGGGVTLNGDDELELRW